VPIKLYDCCAIGRPVIVAAPGEALRLSEEAGAALGVPPQDPEALAAAVRRLRSEAELRARLEAGGRAFAESHLRESQVPVLEDLLNRLRS
jgi:colanic acid biosynthesis glycosyl transferase WcaI